VVNLCLDWQKRKKPVQLNEDFDIADERENTVSAFERMEQGQLLENAIAGLPERQRVAINLCFDEGMTNQEAADIMGINLKALQSLLMRAKTTLKERLKNYS
jgi:RNA polymerase sigma-70 factor (ECF subfamily)